MAEEKRNPYPDSEFRESEWMIRGSALVKRVSSGYLFVDTISDFEGRYATVDLEAKGLTGIDIQLSGSDDDGNSKEMKVVVVSLYRYLFVDFARSGMSLSETLKRASREASVYRHNTDKAVICGHLIFNCRGISSQVLASLGPGESILHAHGFCIAYAVGQKYHLNVMFPLGQLPSGCCPSVLNDEAESVKHGFSCHAILRILTLALAYSSGTTVLASAQSYYWKHDA
ncbi:hypothetical protein ARMGADRAFT_1126333 [Armillaria gallica]|uniref:Uncharacterized protein n=1 Tax=Armillaria gallica TaxID=47427 RepID=A0A2H3ELB7_ARMGA|nr:hypothetical protein ARMGADRAFT_1126333 [Armillaria gallica]